MRPWLPLALLLALALRVPGWTTEDVKAPWRTFAPDETQHVYVAQLRYADLLGRRAEVYRDAPRNTFGYGHLVAYAQWMKGTAGDLPTFAELQRTGRQLSTVFALLLIVIVYRLARLGGLDPPLAGMTAALLAGCDTNATYSHYALPAVGYVFGVYLTVLGGWMSHRGRWWGGGWLGLGAAITLTFKFDFLPLLLLVLPLLSERRLAGTFTAVAALLLGFSLLHYGVPWSDSWENWQFLREVNLDVIPVDDHWRDNLVVYPAGVLAGTGFPAFGLAVYGLFCVVKSFLAPSPAKRFGEGGGRGKASKSFGRPAVLREGRGHFLWLVATLFLAEFAVRYALDTAFIRRVNVFLPAVALLAAYAPAGLRLAPAVRALVVAYSFGLALVGQYNHWFDPRYRARDWLNELPTETRIAASSYFDVEGLRKKHYITDGNWEYGVTAEPYYRRYYRSMTTPFGVPECCEEVYNCGSEEQCLLFQELLLEREPVAVFRPVEVFPERLLYRRWFGYYETFLGEVRIYRR